MEMLLLVSGISYKSLHTSHWLDCGIEVVQSEVYTGASIILKTDHGPGGTTAV